MSSKTLAQLADEIWAWQCETFGDAMTFEGACNKLSDEVTEVLDAWRSLVSLRMASAAVGLPLHADTERVRKALCEELADVFFMLVQLAGLHLEAMRESLFEDGGYYTTGHPVPYWLGRIEVSARHAEDETDLRRLFTEWRAAQAFTDGDIRDAIEAKLAKNKARTWGKPAADGTISHVKGVQR